MILHDRINLTMAARAWSGLFLTVLFALWATLVPALVAPAPGLHRSSALQPRRRAGQPLFMAKVPLVANGKRVEVEEGSSMMAACKRLGLKVPTSCKKGECGEGTQAGGSGTGGGVQSRRDGRGRPCEEGTFPPQRVPAASACACRHLHRVGGRQGRPGLRGQGPARTQAQECP